MLVPPSEAVDTWTMLLYPLQLLAEPENLSLTHYK
jgi:hypothetical protein